MWSTHAIPFIDYDSLIYMVCVALINDHCWLPWQREDQLYVQQQEKRALKKWQEKEAKRLLQQELYGQYTHSSTVDVSGCISFVLPLHILLQ